MRRETNFGEQRRQLVNDLVSQGVIRSEKVKEAFLKVPREEFVWPDAKEHAYFDSPLPLGHTGQTISAPHMVAIMLEELELAEGMEVLEVGAGSGYNAALMAEIVNPKKELGEGKGRVLSVDRIEVLVSFAQNNLSKTGYSNVVTVVSGDGTLGYHPRSEEMIYDRIVVTAAAPYTPKYLKLQLKVGGILLIPVGDPFMQTLLKGVKKESLDLEMKRVCECMFVPLLGEEGYPLKEIGL